ncbi:MAG TPA: hypothetical protein VMA53_08645 [Stellaceae bacterium]|nr:hypothetical protein [Stellaceae bacterium]
MPLDPSLDSLADPALAAAASADAAADSPSLTAPKRCQPRTLEEALARTRAQKLRAEQKEKRLMEKLRQNRTRELIQLGGLVQSVHRLDDIPLPDEVIAYAIDAMLRTQRDPSRKDQLKDFLIRGERVIQRVAREKELNRAAAKTVKANAAKMTDKGLTPGAGLPRSEDWAKHPDRARIPDERLLEFFYFIFDKAPPDTLIADLRSRNFRYATLGGRPAWRGYWSPGITEDVQQKAPGFQIDAFFETDLPAHLVPDLLRKKTPA